MLNGSDISPNLCRVKCWERAFVMAQSDNVGSGFFVLGHQCRVMFYSNQTLPRHRSNISVVFTISGSCRVRLTGSHDKSPAWACVLWKIDSLKVFKNLFSLHAVSMSGPFDMFIFSSYIWSDKCRVHVKWNRLEMSGPLFFRDSVYPNIVFPFSDLNPFMVKVTFM